MATLYEILPDANAIMSLEPEELAGLALELLNSSGPNAPSRLHPTSFSSPETLGAFAPAVREQLAFVLSEGWHWLVQEGLIAPRPGDTFGWHFITRRGQKIRNRAELSAYINAVILPRKLLHPAIASACWSAFLRGEYDTAVFQAYRELEVAIREAGKFNASDYGVDLARRAFDAKGGPLTDMSKPPAEREALSSLVAGALGSYKNPHSHRKVELAVDESVEMIIIASHLLKIVESRVAANVAP
ncbi:MAG: TIGR02391 family protein [Gallionellaceae bacterium]|jgi:uncharacterized protein (TIGR02391 family)